jgi:prevent-host-death family protein
VKIAPVAEVKAQFSRFLDDAQEAPIVVTRNGRPVAVITGVDDPDDLESLVLAHTPRFRRLLEAAQRRMVDSGGVPHDDFWSAVEQPPKRVAEKKPAYKPRKRRA